LAKSYIIIIIIIISHAEIFQNYVFFKEFSFWCVKENEASFEIFKFVEMKSSK
jgi:hypothetical protein